jgi:RNA-directed DNA polymerase
LRRVYIPKEDGRQRPILIPSLEDKILPKATVDLLNAIYEQDFLECSHGFRPGHNAQNALDEVGRVICTYPISTVLGAVSWEKRSKQPWSPNHYSLLTWRCWGVFCAG